MRNINKKQASMPVKKKTNQPKIKKVTKKKKTDWLRDDFSGKLAVDVFQKGNNIIVTSLIAGIKPENVEIFIDNDLLTIRGSRSRSTEIAEKDYLYKECYFGGFSRSVVLPCDVKIDQIKAQIKNGILTITLPKAEKTRKIEVKAKRK